MLLRLSPGCDLAEGRISSQPQRQPHTCSAANLTRCNKGQALPRSLHSSARQTDTAIIDSLQLQGEQQAHPASNGKASSDRPLDKQTATETLLGGPESAAACTPVHPHLTLPVFGSELCSTQQFSSAWRVHMMAVQGGVTASYRALRSLLVCAIKVCFRPCY